MDDTRILDETKGLLDCGHKPSPHGEHTTGTARTNDGREICWDCAHELEKAALLEHDRFFAYLSSDGKNLTDWPGKPIAAVTSLVKRRHNLAGWLYYLQAIDIHGQRWYGTSTGHGMYARIRKAKRQ